MANANIFQTYLQPVRSVADYSAEMDQREAAQLGLQGARQKNAIATLGMQQQVAERNALQAIAQSAGGDTQKLIQGLRSSGMPGLVSQSFDLEKNQTGVQKDKAAIAKDEQEVKAKQYAYLAQSLAGVKDQVGYDNARQIASLFGMDLKGIPEQFDPQFVAQAQGALVTEAQRMTDARAREQQAETGRHNVQSEKNTVRGQDLTASTAMRGQNMTDARSRETNALTREGQQTQIVNDPNQGILLVNKGTGLARPAVGLNGKPIASENAAAAGKLQGQMAEGIKMARDLLPKATASGAGAMVDSAANFIGKSTEGADAASQLDTLAGWLTSNVPKMSGPQSDKDVLLYRQMAANVGDRTKPASQRMAALDTMEQLQKKYGEISGVAAPAAASPASEAGKFTADKESRYQEWKRKQLGGGK